MGSTRPVNEDRSQARRGALRSCTRAPHPAGCALAFAASTRLWRMWRTSTRSSDESFALLDIIRARFFVSFRSCCVNPLFSALRAFRESRRAAIAVLLLSGAAAPELIKSMSACPRF